MDKFEASHDELEQSSGHECTPYNTPSTEKRDESILAGKDDLAVARADSCPSTSVCGDDSGAALHTKSWIAWLLQFTSTRRIFTLMFNDDKSCRKDGYHSGAYQSPRRPWRTSFIRFGPLSGIFAMFLAVASIVSSLGILAGSNGQPVPNWSVPPSTLLAVFTAIANLSMRYAALQGVVIAWWLRAMDGRTLHKLHWDWRSGTTLKGALTAGRHMGLLGLACVFSVIVVIDGPLLQRSSTVVPAPNRGQSITLGVKMSPEMPRDYTGTYWIPTNASDRIPQTAFFNATIPGPNGPVSNHVLAAGTVGGSHGYKVISNWLAGSPVEQVTHGCSGQCKARIHAPALFSTDCATRLIDVNYTNLLSDNELYNVGKGTAPPLSNQAFAIASALDESGEREALILFTGHATLEQCSGVYNYTTCKLESGIGEYEVNIDGNKTTLANPVVPGFVAFANNTPVSPINGSRYPPSTLANLRYQTAWNWESALFYSGKHSTAAYTHWYGTAFQRFQGPSTGANCHSWLDPREEVLASLNSLMFYYGARAASEPASYLETHLDPGLIIDTTVEGSVVGHQNVFHTEYLFFVGAAIVEIVCIALVAPTYWGWWKIGRPVSFSPLEMAKAFGSPMLADCNSNSSGRDLAEAAGDAKVKYGAVGAGHKSEQTKLCFGDPEAVRAPENGMRFDI